MPQNAFSNFDIHRRCRSISISFGQNCRHHTGLKCQVFCAFQSGPALIAFQPTAIQVSRGTGTPTIEIMPRSALLPCLVYACFGALRMLHALVSLAQEETPLACPHPPHRQQQSCKPTMITGLAMVQPQRPLDPKFSYSSGIYGHFWCGTRVIPSYSAGLDPPLAISRTPRVFGLARPGS